MPEELVMVKGSATTEVQANKWSGLLGGNLQQKEKRGWVDLL